MKTQALNSPTANLRETSPPATPKKYQLRSRKAKWLLALGSIIVVFGLLEVAARIYVARKYGKATFGMNWKFSYEPYLITRTDDRLEVAVPPKSEKFRVLLIGGSTASLVPPQFLADAFTRTLNRDTEVVNLGQGGYILNQERIMLALHGIKLKPDLVITLDGNNDIMSTAKTGKPGLPYSDGFVRMAVEQPIANGLFGFLRESQFINCLNKLRERKYEKQIQGDTSLLDATIAHVGETQEAISVMSHGLGAPHVMVVQPYLHLRKTVRPEEKEIVDVFAYRADYTGKGIRGIYDHLVKTQAQHAGETYVIDGTKAFDASEAVCFTDEAHLTEEGNRILCDYIAKSLSAQGFPQKTAAAAMPEIRKAQ